MPSGNSSVAAVDRWFKGLTSVHYRDASGNYSALRRE